MKTLKFIFIFIFVISIFYSCSDNKNPSPNENGKETCENKKCTDNQICEIISDKAVCKEKPIETGKLRVYVKDIYGNPIKDAKIKVDKTEKLTNNDGIVVIDNDNETNDILITSNAYKSVSLMDVTKKDLAIYMYKKIAFEKAGGFKGNFNYDDPSIINNGHMKLGLAGSSFNTSLLEFKFRYLFGMDISRDVQFTSDFPIASNIECLVGESILSPRYNVVSNEESHIFWGIGGRINFGDILGDLQKLKDESDNDNISDAEIMAILTPFTNKFNYSIKLNQEVTLCDKIADTEDINTNENITELIPNFESSCFTAINMKLEQPLTLNTKIKMPKLPLMMDKKTTSTLINIFTIMDNHEVVMLGMGAGRDKIDEDDMLDQNIEDVNVNFSSQFFNTKNTDSLVVLTTFRPKNISEELSKRSSIIKLYKNGEIEKDIDLSSETYLKLVDNIKIENNILSFNSVEGKTFYRITITDINHRQWVIYTDLTNVSIENKPNDISDIKSIMVQAIQIKDGNNLISYNNLLENNANNMDDLIRLVVKYSNSEVKFN